VLIHGGTWRGGDKHEMDPLAEAIARLGWAGLSVNYRLDAPNNAIQAELEDVQAAVRWARASAKELRIDPARIAAFGQSAGGTLAALLGTVDSGPLIDGARVRAVVSRSGPMNVPALMAGVGLTAPCLTIACITPDQWVVILGQVIGCPLAACPALYDAASPVRHVDPTDAPMLLVNSVGDLTVPLSHAVGMATVLRAAGVPTEVLPVPGSAHAQLAPLAWTPTIEFLSRYLGPAST
jgi:acetyl esterase